MAEHQRIAASAAMPNALPRMALHSGHLDKVQRFSRPFPRLCRTYSFEMVPTPGIAPGTTAVRSGVCIFYYTLWALNWLLRLESHQHFRFNRAASYCWITEEFEMVEPDGNAPSLAGCKPAVQSSTLRSLGNWRSVRAMLPRLSARQVGALLTELTNL